MLKIQIAVRNNFMKTFIMTWKLRLITLVVILVTWPQVCGSEVHYLQQGNVYSYKQTYPVFRIFCYIGQPKYLIHIWRSVVLQLDHPSEEYSQYDGSTPEEVQQEYKEHRFSWSINIFSSKRRHVRLDPFNQSCIGIASAKDYAVHLNVIRIDYWKLLLLLSGICLFFSANRLSGNTIFYYLCGVTLGICTSILILIYFISKLFPKKPIMYGVAACGWTIGIYVLQLLWDNIRIILQNYQSYVMWYVLGTGFISFILCYRWGPIENERSRNLIRWTLQGVGLGAVFFSTQFQEAAMGQIVALLLFYNLPRSWLSESKKFWKRKFPPKVKLITNDEYYEQGVRETSKALGELRSFCSSPNCKPWKLARTLKDVKRFASFMDGDSHLLDEEILEYETSIQATEFTDDDSDYTEEEQ